MKKFILISAAIATVSLFVAAQTTSTATKDNGAPTIRKVAAPSTSPSSGKDNYVAYCAACHGASGKGDGPAAPALKMPVTDLTKLSAANGGKFPSMHVQQMIRDVDNPAHGSKEMPVWGPVFRSLAAGNQGQVELRITNLTKYIESIQGK